MSQRSLGIEAGIDQFSASARMNQYETDKHIPDYRTIERVAKVLKVPPAYFYCEDDDLAELIKAWAGMPKSKRKKMKEEAKKSQR